MTPPNPLTELAERVERLTGPCRETDCLIFESQHLLLMPCHRGTIDGDPTGEYYDTNGDQLAERAPFYTASLDAAMTLVPEGYAFVIGRMALARTDRKPWATYWTPQGEPHGVEAATPALALTAAALRARAASENSHG